MTMCLNSPSAATPSMNVVRETVCFDSFLAKRTLDDSCRSQNKRLRYSETLPPCFPTLPDTDENEADVIAGFDVPTLNLSMKKIQHAAIAKPIARRVSVSPPSSVEPLLHNMSLEESPAWSMDAEDAVLELPTFASTPKVFPIVPRLSQICPLQQDAGDVTAPSRRRSSDFPDSIFLPELPSP